MLPLQNMGSIQTTVGTSPTCEEILIGHNQLVPPSANRYRYHNKIFLGKSPVKECSLGLKESLISQEMSLWSSYAQTKWRHWTVWAHACRTSHLSSDGSLQMFVNIFGNGGRVERHQAKTYGDPSLCRHCTCSRLDQAQCKHTLCWCHFLLMDTTDTKQLMIYFSKRLFVLCYQNMIMLQTLGN